MVTKNGLRIHNIDPSSVTNKCVKLSLRVNDVYVPNLNRVTWNTGGTNTGDNEGGRGDLKMHHMGSASTTLCEESCYDKLLSLLGRLKVQYVIAILDRAWISHR